MEDLTHWDFADQFSGHDAAALILGVEPRESDGEQWRVRVVTERMELHYMHARRRYYHEAFKILEDFPDMQASRPLELASVKMNELHHQCCFHDHDDDEETPFSTWLASDQSQFDDQVFSRHVVARWLEAIGMKPMYKFSLNQPEHAVPITGPGYLDPGHARYSPKLAAAIHAWVAAPQKNKGSQKQALEKWLREHASELGLTDVEGNPVKQAMTECSTVANWDTKGGATKTPGN